MTKVYGTSHRVFTVRLGLTVITATLAIVGCSHNSVIVRTEFSPKVKIGAVYVSTVLPHGLYRGVPFNEVIEMKKDKFTKVILTVGAPNGFNAVDKVVKRRNEGQPPVTVGEIIDYLYRQVGRSTSKSDVNAHFGIQGKTPGNEFVTAAVAVMDQIGLIQAATKGGGRANDGKASSFDEIRAAKANAIRLAKEAFAEESAELEAREAEAVTSLGYDDDNGEGDQLETLVDSAQA